MFLDFYRLGEQPFNETPNPRYLHLSATHRGAPASLFYGITTGRRFLALIAGPGIGKTTLLFHLPAANTRTTTGQRSPALLSTLLP